MPSTAQKAITVDYFKTNVTRELIREKQASIGRKIAAIEVKFELLIEAEEVLFKLT